MTWSPAHMATTQTPMNSMVLTPPPEESKFPPPYPQYPNQPWSNFGIPPNPTAVSSMAPAMMHNTLSDCFMYGSSLEESPLSSPGSTDSSFAVHEQQLSDDLSYGINQPIMTTAGTYYSPLCDNVYTPTNMMLPAGYEPVMAMSFAPNTTSNMEMKDEIKIHTQKEIKMPQRKGGIQLWQFLYSLLTNPEKKYRDLIEWTANLHEKEFRMLEPESIAIWWGHHKNKPCMTYDKFSRSLRYYYDKGILKKIPGERYVYRFLIDPELMYHHIGIINCRPKVKPMPQAAKAAMGKFQRSQSNIDTKTECQPIVTQEPELLVKSLKTDISSIQSSSRANVNSWALPNSSSSLLQVSSSNPLQSSASIGNLARCSGSLSPTEVTSLPMKRCRSLESSSSHVQADSMKYLPSNFFGQDYLSTYSHMNSSTLCQPNGLVTSSSHFPITSHASL